MALYHFAGILPSSSMSSLWLRSRAELRFNLALTRVWDALLKGCLPGTSLGQNHFSAEVLPYPEVLKQQEPHCQPRESCTGAYLPPEQDAGKVEGSE